ncbi:MAG: hypothetical protein H3C43_08015 [Leptonema sp. (in: Bacteria)]|nr:hypothetical protein [Leptonema sp. (in: bacteria)]
MKKKTIQWLTITILLTFTLTSTYAKSADDQKAEQLFKAIVASIAKVSGALENSNSTPQATAALNNFAKEFRQIKSKIDNSSEEVQMAFVANHGEELQLHIDTLKDTINTASTNGKFDEDNDAFIAAIMAASSELTDDE